MNAKSFVAVAAILAIVLPLRSDTPKPPAPAGAQPIEQMIAELKQVAELVQQLEDKSFAKRQEASARLVRIGKPAVEPLQRMVAGKPSLEMAARIQTILREIKKQQFGKNLSGKEIREALARKIDLEQGIPPQTTLKEALGYFSNKYGLPILIDSDMEGHLVQLPKMADVPLRAALRLLLSQIQIQATDGSGGILATGTFVVQDNRIKVALSNRVDPEKWYFGSDGPMIDAKFNGKELSEALRELANSSGVNVVVDPKVGEKARTKVTATLNNVRLDTAVRVLADMARLRIVVMPNMLYVTSGENAKELRQENKERYERQAAQFRASMGIR